MFERYYEALEKSRALPEGTVRVWAGKKYIKKQGAWYPYTEYSRDTDEEILSYEEVMFLDDETFDDELEGEIVDDFSDNEPIVKIYRKNKANKNYYSYHDAKGGYMFPLADVTLNLRDTLDRYSERAKTSMAVLNARKQISGGKEPAAHRFLVKKDKLGWELRDVKLMKGDKREDAFIEEFVRARATGRRIDFFKFLEKAPVYRELEIQVRSENLEKARAAQIGEERTWGGKVYVKTAKGWRPKTKGRGAAKPEEEGGVKAPRQEEQGGQDRKAVLEGYASNATDEQLEAAMKKPGQSEEVKEIAKQELESRGKETEEEVDEVADSLKKLIASGALEDVLVAQLKDALREHEKKKEAEKKKKEEPVDEKLEAFQKEVTERLDKIEQEIGQKKIKKTGIMINGKKVFITMKGEDRYQSKHNGETLVSEEGESLADFKKRMREKWEKKDETPKEEPKKEETPKEETAKEEKQEEGTDDRDTLPESDAMEKAINKLKKTIEVTGITKDTTYSTIMKGNLGIVLGGKRDKNRQLKVNAALINSGKLPVMEPFMFTEHGGEKYECYDEYFMDTGTALDRYKKKYRPEADDLTEDENRAMLDYSDGYDRDVRNMNTMGEKAFKNLAKIKFGDNEYIYILDRIKDVDRGLSDWIDKHRLKNNIILSRRMRFASGKNPFIKLKVGDTFTDPSFGSYSMRQLSDFGEGFQITLLAKKGQAVSAIRSAYPSEMEFLTQKKSKFRVVAVGTKSIAVELVD